LEDSQLSFEEKRRKMMAGDRRSLTEVINGPKNIPISAGIESGCHFDAAVYGNGSQEPLVVSPRMSIPKNTILQMRPPLILTEL
jgi:hypothetical protein